jgi:CRP/FNR family transcriptional regulator
MEQEFSVAAGHVILEQGQEGSGFYILNSGTLEVYKDDILLAVLMYPGTVFGEIGDILGRPRTCSVKAKTDATVTYHLHSDLDTLVRQEPEIAVKIMRTLASRLDRTTQKLIDTARENPLWTTK